MKWSLFTHCQMPSLGLQDKTWQKTIPLVFHSHRSLCPHMARLVLSESPTSRLPQHYYGNAIGTENKNTASFLPSFQFTFDENTNISPTIYLVFMIHFKLHLLIIKKFPQKINTILYNFSPMENFQAYFSYEERSEHTGKFKFLLQCSFSSFSKILKIWLPTKGKTWCLRASSNNWWGIGVLWWRYQTLWILDQCDRSE